MKPIRIFLTLTFLTVLAVTLFIIAVPKLPRTYTVSTYVAYYGSWTILKIDDPNRQTHFYLAYQRDTHQTLTDQNYQSLLDQIQEKQT